jgi:hypothetical protein
MLIFPVLLLTVQIPRAIAPRFALPAAGEKKVEKRESAKAMEKLEKRAESQPSAAYHPGDLPGRCVGR